MLAVTAKDLLFDVCVTNVHQGTVSWIFDAVVDEVLASRTDGGNREVLAEFLRGYVAGVAFRGLDSGRLVVGSLKGADVELVILILDVFVVLEKPDGAILVNLN